MLSFRSIEPTDQEFLCRLYASTREEELSAVPWSGAEKAAFLESQFLAQHTYYQEQFANASFQVLDLDGIKIGRLYVDRRIDEIRLIDIALLPEFRDQGIGSKIIKELLQEASEHAKPVRIHVEGFNPALRLYRRLGFQLVEDRGVYQFMEWRPELNRSMPKSP